MDIDTWIKPKAQQRQPRISAAALQTKLYKYEPLLRPRRIRLINVRAVRDIDEPVECNIVEADIAAEDLSDGLYSFNEYKPAKLVSGETVEYAALSYVWGEPNFTKTLNCPEGTVLHITKTLDIALRRLREARVYFIWVDAISINQSDVVERTAQVKIMGSIYDQAKRVHVWLGEKNAETLDFISVVPDYQRSSNRIFGYGRSRVIRFLQYPFWSRRWIIQEVMLARELVFHSGAVSINEYQLFSGLATIEGTLQFLLGLGSEDKERIKTILTMRTTNGRRHENHLMMGGHKESTPISMLRAFSGYKCSDDKDIIFALLGLLGLAKTSRSSLSFRRLLQSFDYRVSAQSSYIELARYHLTFMTKSPRCVENLLECALSTRFRSWPDTGTIASSNTSIWPSWLPDWRTGIIYRPSPSAEFKVEPCILEVPSSEGYFEAERFRRGSSAIHDDNKCLTIAALLSEEIVWVEDEPVWDDKRCRSELSKGPIRKFRTRSGLICYGHPSVRSGDFLAFVGRARQQLFPFAFRPRTNTPGPGKTRQALLVGDCIFRHAHRDNNRDLEVDKFFSRLDLY